MLKLLIVSLAHVHIALSVTCAYNPSATQPALTFVLLAVSGTLEDNFELRANIDYWPNKKVNNNGRVNATFIGKTLVRGYKAFLDIKDRSWREYKDDGINEVNSISGNGTPLKTINPALLPTHCDKHANQYSLYLVDSRAAFLALAGEPRFLSIAPDMGLSDLNSTYTSDAVKKLAFRKITEDLAAKNIASPPNMNRIAFLTVTSTTYKGFLFVC